jgi:hypothetical protein
MSDDALDPRDDRTVVYDLSEWEPEQIDTLEWALGREGVPALLRDGELTVREDVEELEAGDVDRGDADLDEMEALGELFVAADRLVHRADDQVVRAEFELAVEALEGAPVPYGFDDGVWARITTMAAWLVDELDGAGPELIEKHAQKLRDLLRQYV